MRPRCQSPTSSRLGRALFPLRAERGRLSSLLLGRRRVEQHVIEVLLELLGKAADHRLRVRGQRGVGDEAELHLAGVGEDRHAHADVAGLRHPEERLLERAAGDRQRLGRARHVGHHRGRAAEQEVEQLVLHDFRQIAERGEQAERDRRLVGRLQLEHALAHRHQPLERVLDADRQQDRDDAETVAELERRPARAGRSAPARGTSTPSVLSPLSAR